MVTTNIYILGASYPMAGKKPAVLQEISEKTKVLDWQLNSFGAINSKQINFLGGYHIEDVVKHYPEINYILVKNWESNTILDTFFQCPLEDSGAIFTYADTIFRPEILKKISQSTGDITVAIDVNYENRYDNRSEADLEIAEIIIPNHGEYRGHKSEFTGLFHIKSNVANIIKSLKSNIVGHNLLDLLSYLEGRGFHIDFIDVGSNWAELNEPQDIARFILGNKAQTLSRLAPMVKKSKIGKQISFTVEEWVSNSDAIILQIQQIFSGKQLIIRSSASQEDGWSSSLAGQYTSILNVDSGSIESIIKVVKKVISSYRENKNNSDDQILVQEFLNDINISGVVFTCQLETGAPYHTFNFQDNEGSIEAITSGTSQDDRTIVLHNKEVAQLKKVESKLEPIRKAIDELKGLLSFDKLDVEFAIDKKGLVHILQVRPITVDHREYDDVANLFEDKLEESAALFTSFQGSSAFVLGETTSFSNMSDWNPAEIIGIHPNPLAFSLYRFLITDDVWAKQRSEFGYRDIGAHPLIVSFCGQPYVDLRASFNSFIPATIDDQLAKKLITAYLGNLSSSPEYHDKIEFDIAITSWTPTFRRNAEEKLMPWGVNSKEIDKLEEALKLITSNAIVNFKKHTSMQNLRKRRVEILQSKIKSLNKGCSLLSDCKNNGTLAFAHAARHGFVAISFLKSLIENEVLTKDEVDLLMSSIDGVPSNMQKDQIALLNGQITLKKIITKYGHLRPGTYDATAPAYWEDPKYYLKPENSKINIKSSIFKLSKKQQKSITEFLEDLGLVISADELIDYIKKAIVVREETKLEFTRNLSSALDCFIEFGQGIGVSRHEIVYLEYQDFEQLAFGNLNFNEVSQIIKSRMIQDKLNQMFEIPPLIKSKKDFYCFEHYDAQINFITNKKIISELKNLNTRVHDNLEGKIILTRQADPGYDWVFSCNIVGLITQHGGANSHMAIRAAELGLPAAIGIGSKLFNKLAKSNKIKLDCGNHNIIIIN